MLDIRNKLANTADDFKVTDRLFAWILILGYRNTDRYLADDMENDVTRGAKTPQEVIRQLQHIGEREKVFMSTAAVHTGDKRKRPESDSKPQSKYAPWPTCAPCGGRKHPPNAHQCKTCYCFHTNSNPCAPKCGKKCNAEFHYLSCNSKSRFFCPADRLAFENEYTTTATTINPPSASNAIFNTSGHVETYGYGPGKAAAQQSHIGIETYGPSPSQNSESL